MGKRFDNVDCNQLVWHNSLFSTEKWILTHQIILYAEQTITNKQLCKQLWFIL